MRFAALPLLTISVLAVGCFEEPGAATSSGNPPIENGSGTTTTVTSDSTTGETTSETSGGAPSTGGPASTGGPTSGSSTGDVGAETTGTAPRGEVWLYPLACTEASFEAGAAGMLRCGAQDFGPFVDTHDSYRLGDSALPRVIEVRPAQVAGAPVDGFFEIDTSAFADPLFRSRVACSVDDGCQIDFLITSELDGRVLSSWGGAVVAGEGVAEVQLILPPDPELVIHLNASAPVGIGESRFLWIDPRVVEADS